MFTHTSDSEAETQRLGRLLAGFLQAGAVVLLDGDLGAGKTVFARGVVYGLAGEGMAADGDGGFHVPSPTFTLVNSYESGRLPVHHWDFYRIGSADELIETGIDDLIGMEASRPGVALIEWWRKGAFWIPGDHLRVTLNHDGDDPEKRIIHITAQGVSSKRILHDFQRENNP